MQMELLSREEMLRREPALSPNLLGATLVPQGAREGEGGREGGTKPSARMQSTFSTDCLQGQQCVL